MNTTPPAPRPPRQRRWLRRLGIALAALVMVTAACLGWLLCTPDGLRFALTQAQRFTHGALQVQQAQGRLIGPLDIGSLRYDDGKGTRADITRVHLDWRIASLLYKRLHIVDLNVDRLDVALPAPQENTSSSSFSLKPPIELVLDRVHVGPVSISRQNKPLFASDTLDLSGRWTNSGFDINRLALVAPAGHVTVQGRLAIGRRYRGRGTADLAWKVGDTVYAGTLNAQGDGRNAQLQLALAQPMAAELKLNLDQRRRNAWTASLDVPAFDPKPLLGDSSITRLGLNLRGNGDQLGGTLNGEVDLNAYRLLLQPLRASVDKDFKTLTVQQLQLASPQIKGTLGATGTVHLDAHPLSAELALDWKNLELPAELAGQVLASQGHVSARGSANAYHAEGDVTIGPPGKPVKLALNLDGTPQQIQLHTLSLLQPQGRFTATGSLTLQPDLAWQLQANADRFDPGLLFAGWQGSLNADLNTQGKLADNQPDVTLDLRKLDGVLRQRQLRGAGHLHLAPSHVVDGKLDLASGRSSVTLLARPGGTNNADITLAIASLNDWLPQAAGTLNGKFHVRGKYPALSVNGTLQGQSLNWSKQTVRSLQLQADVPDISHPGGKLAVAATGAEVGGLSFAQIHLNAQGNQAQHQLTLDAHGQPLSLSLALNGGMKAQNWNGTLTALTLDVQGLPRWHLQQAAKLAWNNGAASLGDLCLSAGEPLLCVNGNQDKGGNLNAGYRLHAVPLALVLDAAGGAASMPVSAEGVLEGNGKLRRSAAGVLTGNASITSAHGHVTYNDQPDQPLLTYKNLSLQATLASGNQQATLHAELNDQGRLDGQIAVTGAQQTLSGQVGLHLNDLAFASLLTDRVANVKGHVDGDFKLGGTVSAPAITGQAGIDGFAAEIPDAGLKLTNGKLVASATDAHELRIDGSVQSGKGTLSINGTAALDAQTPTAITLKGSQVTAIDIPAAKVAITPDLLVRHDAQGIEATGSVRLDSADVNLGKLPGGGVNKASPDVVVVDEPQAEANSAATPISASIKVDMGQHAHLVGMGLDGHLTGAITVDETPGRATTGQGQITVDGTYKAYGQNLQIQQGQLLFASTPIDNPGLNIKAVRSLQPNATISQGQQVGLQITGTARRPVLNVFSNPAMDQSDALAYLVTGKPLSQVNSGEGSMVNSAAQALGSATGNLLAKSIGSKLGIEDIGVSSSDALNGGSAFTVGKYLSPRLYLSYGIGLFEPGQVITLRYRISRRWNFEAQNATDFNRASINYRIEK